MCWNTIRLQKSMKQSSNIDPEATREQLEGYYREIVCNRGEISDQAFICYGSSLHVQVLTVIFINPSPPTDHFLIYLVCLLLKFKSKILTKRNAVTLLHWQMFSKVTYMHLCIHGGVHAYTQTHVEAPSGYVNAKYIQIYIYIHVFSVGE